MGIEYPPHRGGVGEKIQLADLAGNAVLSAEGSVSSLNDVIVNFLSGGLASQQQLELGNDLLVHQLLGGGGHLRAAGCEVVGSIETVKKAILKEVENALCQ